MCEGRRCQALNVRSIMAERILRNIALERMGETEIHFIKRYPLKVTDLLNSATYT